MKPAAVETEPTDQGGQCLVPGVKPVTERDRLRALMAAPLSPTRPQKRCDLGLFDEAARNQLDIFDFIRAAGGGAAFKPKPKEQDPWTCNTSP